MTKTFVASHVFAMIRFRFHPKSGLAVVTFSFCLHSCGIRALPYIKCACLLPVEEISFSIVLQRKTLYEERGE